MLQTIEQFITTWIVDYGYLAIFVLMFLESCCIPIPSEVTMLFAGALCSATFIAADQQLDLVTVIMVGTVANLLGSQLAYYIGYKGGRPMIDRWGRYILLKPHEVDRAHAWFEKRGEAIVFFSRLLPIVRTFISLPAGVARMGFWKFSIYTFLGCLPWCAALAYGGYLVGANWEELKHFLEPATYVVAVALVAVIGWWIYKRLKERKEATV